MRTTCHISNVPSTNPLLTPAHAEVYEEPVTTINLEIALYLAIAVAVLLLILSIMSCYICRIKRIMNKERTEMTGLRSVVAGGDGPLLVDHRSTTGELEGGSGAYEKLSS
jgi:hypothetical protein